MDSLRWVDATYVQKHRSEDPHNLRAMYAPNLEQYSVHAPKAVSEKKGNKTPLNQAIFMYAIRQGRKAGISLGVLALSYVPYLGRFVLPAASFYTFRKSVGTQPAVVIFMMSLFFPRKYLVSFLQAYFSSRTLMRELVRGILSASTLFRVSTNLLPSWSPTSLVSTITLNRRSFGSRTAPVYFLGLVWVSISSLRFPWWEYSYTVLQRLPPPTSSPRSRNHLRLQPKPKSSRQIRSAGRTSTSS